MIIDAHHHFWKYDPVEYDWIDDKMQRIKKDFLPEDLKKETERAGVDGVITVQARQTIAETGWLLSLAEKYPFIKGVTGWLPLADNSVESLLNEFSQHKKLKALRHVLQGEPDEYMLRQDFNKGIDLLEKYNLLYEILIFENQLPVTIRFVDRHPHQIFVLDHIAKPRILENMLSPWRENLKELAKRENVYCKISGLVTEADFTHWTEEQLEPYLETVMETFGPNRLLFGSDWPVLLVACDYRRWVHIIQKYISGLSDNEQKAIMGGNAIRVYGLNR